MNRDTILIVEDDPLLRSDTMAAFEGAGLRVVDCGTADEALGYLLDRPDDVAVVFTDVHMPGHSDGIHLAEVIVRHWPKIHVLVTSGRAEPARDLPEQVRFIPKPWSSERLIETVRETLPA